MTTAAKATEPNTKGMNRTRNGETTEAGEPGEKTINVPFKASAMVLENTGSNIMRIVFGSDAFSNAFEIPPNAGQLSRVTFGVNGGKDIKVRSTVGATTYQYILSG